jgi:2-iminobutanoate/2-iminopropanoate deaminase
MAARKHRQSIELQGVTHAAPIPMGARVGNMVFSSGIAGKDPASDTLPPEPERQAYFAFENMKRLLALAGSGLGDVGHVTVFINDDAMRDHVNREWFKHFPDEFDRPARHTILLPNLPRGMKVQLEIIAVVADDAS